MSFFVDFDRQIHIQSLVNQIAFTLARCECNVGGCPKCEVEGQCESFKIYQVFAREILANCSFTCDSLTKKDILQFEKSMFLDSLCSELSDLCLYFGGGVTKLNIVKKDDNRFFITLPHLFVDKKDVRIGVKFVDSNMEEKDNA